VRVGAGIDHQQDLVDREPVALEKDDAVVDAHDPRSGGDERQRIALERCTRCALPSACGVGIAIALGAVSANVLNIYSGALSFTAIGIKLPLKMRRAIVALGFGAIGFFLAWSGLHNAGTKYEDFLLIIAYWIAPWLAVYFCDLLLRRDPDETLLFATRRTNWAGPVAMLIGMGISIWLFSNQTEYVGVVPKHFGSAGDLTFEVGFVITAVIYLGWHAIAKTGREQTLAA